MIFRPRQKTLPITRQIIIENNVLEQVNNTKFLGVDIDQHLDFLKVVRLVFWSGVVGPGTNDFYPLQRAKFTGGIFLL